MRRPTVLYLSYPWADDDGTLWSSDFVYGSLVHFATNMSTARVWTLPVEVNAPSKIARIDGKLWITFFFSSNLGRFDETTGQLDVFSTGVGTNPYDLHAYRGRILYSDQAGQIGFLDPAGSVPVTFTLTSTDQTPFITGISATTAGVSTLASTDDPISLSYLGSVQGVESTDGGLVSPSNGSAVTK